MNTAALGLAAGAFAAGLIMLDAGIGKLRAPRATATAIDAYAILGAGAGRILALPFALLESLAGLALLWPCLRVAGAWLTAALLLLYSAAIAIALLRGNTDFDCGCGGLAGEAAPGFGMLMRNAVLLVVMAALVQSDAAAPAGAREWLAVFGLCGMLLLVYGLVNLRLARSPADD